MPPVTMRQIASACGVSVSTVSLSLSNHPRIPHRTKNRILQKAKEFNYHPNLLARALVKRSSQIITVLVPPLENIFSDPFYVQGLEGIYTALEKHNFKILLEVTSEKIELYKKSADKIFNNGLTGGMIILGGHPSEYNFVRELYRNYPVIIVGGYLPGSQVPFVTGDNFRAGYIATEHLIKLGHRNIAYVSGSLEVLSARDRFRGYCSALKKHNLKFRPEIVVDGHSKEWQSYIAVSKLLEEYKSRVRQTHFRQPSSKVGFTLTPTPRTSPKCEGTRCAWFSAIVGGNDLMAIGAMRAIKERRLRIPEDIAVVGIDNIPQAEFTEPPLTTVQYPVFAMGVYAAEQLMNYLNNKVNNNTVRHREVSSSVTALPSIKKVFGVEFVVRKSCSQGRRLW